MTFDRAVLFDRSKPRGERLRGEAVDEIVYHVEQNVPPAENYITRIEFNPTTKVMTVYMMDKSTGVEFIAAEFTVPTAQGIPGPVNKLTVGTVTEGPSASVTITGDAPEQVINLVLPRALVNKLEVGDVTSGPVPEVTITGTPPNQVIDFVLPKGDKGDTGEGIPPGASWSDKQDYIDPGTTAQYYRGDKTWQTLNKAAVGLGNVDNTSDLDKPVSTATATQLNTKQATIVAGTTAQYYRGDKTWQTLNKAAVGLSNVDNTSDMNKPVSTATTTQLNLKQNLSEKNAANGYAGLDSSGLVPSSLLPAFVDDVLEFANLAGFPATGEAGKIYTELDTNKIYRWGGSAYTEISPSPGSTDSVTEGSVNLYYTQARADARAAAALAARSVIAGTGLTGGGALSADRTLSVSYGTSAGTACQGNDTRLTNTRTPTDNTVSTAKIVDANVTKAKLETSVQTSLDKADAALPKSSTPSQVYGTDGSGNQATVTYSTTATASTFALRDASGRIKAADASASDDVITKSQLDAAQLIAINSQSSAYTLVLSDANKAVESTSASAVNITVPPNSSVAYPVGTVIEIAQVGNGQITIVAGSGVTINTPATLKSRTQWATLVLRKRATDTWLLAGDMAAS